MVWRLLISWLTFCLSALRLLTTLTWRFFVSTRLCTVFRATLTAVVDLEGGEHHGLPVFTTLGQWSGRKHRQLGFLLGILHFCSCSCVRKTKKPFASYASNAKISLPSNLRSWLSFPNCDCCFLSSFWLLLSYHSNRWMIQDFDSIFCSLSCPVVMDSSGFVLLFN